MVDGFRELSEVVDLKSAGAKTGITQHIAVTRSPGLFGFRVQPDRCAAAARDIPEELQFWVVIVITGIAYDDHRTVRI